jgi:hypothetical protein
MGSAMEHLGGYDRRSGSISGLIWREAVGLFGVDSTLYIYRTINILLQNQYQQNLFNLCMSTDIHLLDRVTRRES